MAPPHGSPRGVVNSPSQTGAFFTILDWYNQPVGHGHGRRLPCPQQVKKWYLRLYTYSQLQFSSFKNMAGKITVNNLELGKLLLQIILFFWRMDPLKHI